MLLITLIIGMTLLTGGAAYESCRFVVGAWNYAVMVLLYAILTVTEWAGS